MTTRSDRAADRWTVRGVGLGLAFFVIGSWALRFVGHGTFPPIDPLLYFFPIYEATYGRLASGEIPVWNPYQLCGEPWFATLQAGFFYPSHVLYFLLSLPTAYAVSGVLHLVVAALAMLAFCRRAGLGLPAGVLAAAIFTLRGRMPYALIQPNFLEAMTWLPLGALAVFEIVRGSRRRGAMLLAVATALSLLAGYPQPTAYCIYAWTLLLLALLLDARAWRAWPRALLPFIAAGAVGALAAAVQLLPAAELTAVGTRQMGGLDPETVYVMSIFTPAPRILGGGAIAGDPHSYGVVALALVPVALLAARTRALAAWAIVVAVLSGLFALAGWGPLFRVYLALPLIGSFRYPDRMLVLTDFAIAVAAAVGLDVLTNAPTRAARWAASTVALGSLLGVVVLAARGWTPPTQVSSVYATALIAAAVFAMVVRPPAGNRGHWPAIAIVALAMVEISRTGWHGVRLPYSQDEVLPYDQLAASYRELAARTGASRSWLYHTGIRPALGPKQATRYEFRAIDDYEPMNTLRQAEYFVYLLEGAPRLMRSPWIFSGTLPTLDPRPDVAPPATRRRLLDLAALRFFTLPAGRRGPAEEAFLRDAGFAPVPSAIPGFAMYENPNAMPRAFVTYRTRSAPPADELLARIANADFDPLVESYVEAGPELGSPTAPPRGHVATIVRDEEATVEIDATLAADGLVVLADAFYPGWRATVDGAEVPIYATNHLFRGALAPAGTHRVRFEYHPRSLVVGTALSAAGLLAIVALATRRTTAA